MKFTTLQENFLSALQTANRAISTKPQLPILTSFLLEITKDNQGILSATDLQLGIRVTFPVKTQTAGKTVVPHKLLTDVVAAADPGELACQIVDHRFQISSSQTKAHLQTSPADEYPEFPKQEGEVIKLPKAVFSEVDRMITFAASKDETRPVLTGVFFTIDEQIEAAATDGYRLALLTQKISNTKPLQILFPARAIGEIQKIVEKSKSSTVDFHFAQDLKQAFFQFEETAVVVRTLDGDFPAYHKIIPRDFKISVLLDREQLEHHVRTALLFARDISSVLKLELKDNVCRISAGSGVTGEYEATIELSSEVAEPSQIAFNGRFVQDILQRIQTKEVEFLMNEEMKPGAFKEVGNEDFLYVVMPFRLNE